VSFNYEFGSGKKEIYFAHSLPYTYSMLNEYLTKNKVKRNTLCHSLAGNKVEYLIITNKPKPKDQEPLPDEDNSPKKGTDKKKKEEPKPGNQ
jgi:hypothetical protein